MKIKGMKNIRANIKPIILGTMVTAGAVATVFTMNANSIKSLTTTQKIKNANQEVTINTIQSPSGTPLFTPRMPEKAPKNLFTLKPALNLSYNDAQEIEDHIQPIFDGAFNLGLPDDMVDEFANAYKNAFFKSNPFLYQRFQRATDEGIEFFTDLNSIHKIFKDMNQFHTTTNEIDIYAPSFVYDVNAAGAVGIKAAILAKNRSSFEKVPTNVKYTVASINMGALKDQDEVLDFTIKVPNKLGSTILYEDYHLLLNNNQNAIVQEFDPAMNPAPTQDVNKLFNEGKIILRDLKREVGPATPIDVLSGLISLSYDGNSLNVNVNSEGYDEAHAIKFKATDAKTSSLVKVGFLDSSISPLHDHPTIAGSQPFETPNKSIKDIVVRAMNAKQSSNAAGGKTFTMWMAQDSSIKLSLLYRPAPGTWVNGNEMTLAFDGTSVSSTPTSLSLNKGTQVPASGLVHFDAQKTTIPIDGVQYAKVEVYTDDAEIEINNNTNVRIPGAGDERIFFEMPGHDRNLNPQLDSKVSNELKVSTSTDVTDKWREYINGVYGSWFQLDAGKPEQWKLAAPQTGTADPITGLNGEKRQYNFDYEFFYENANGGIIKNPSGTKNALLAGVGIAAPEALLPKHDPLTFAPTSTGTTLDSTEAFGENIAKMLSDYYNKIVKWQQDKFGIVTNLKPEDFYNLADPSDLDRVVKNIELNAPLSYSKLVERADAIVRLLWEGDGTVTSQQTRFLDGLDDTTSEFYFPLGINIKATLNRAIGGSSTVNTNTGDIHSWTSDMIKANKIAMVVIEREIVKALEEIFKNENIAFESVYRSLLGKSITKYLDGNGVDYKAISPTVIQLVPESVLDPRLAGEKIISLNGKPDTIVRSGKEQLKSLLDFIANFGLETKYLAAAKAKQFLRFYQSGIMLDSQAYSSSTDRVNIGNMITILDELIKNIIAGSKIEKIENIIADIEQGKINAEQASVRIEGVLNAVIEKIVSPSLGAFTYNILSAEYQSSYLENQVMGKNLSSVLNAWLKTNSSRLSATKLSQLKQSGLYDPSTLVNIAVSVGFYNFDYFVESMTRRSLVPATTKELLDSNFEDSIIFEIPKSNTIIDFLSNPKTLVKYGFVASGGLIALTGLLTFGISATKLSKSDSKSSAKSKLASKVMFIGATVIGLIIMLVGFTTL